MTGYLVCPRLGVGAGEIAASSLKQAWHKDGLSGVVEQIPFEHRDAAPVETGQPITKEQLRQLRTRVLSHFPDGARALPPREFDLTLGRALVTELPFVESDLHHGSTWSFLTLCVFPDLLCIRWPTFNRDRALGTPRKRNALQRVWLREKLLGPVIHQPGVALAEDEFEQIIGRSSVARVPSLPILMVEALVRVQPSGRAEQLARVFGKLLVLQTGVLLLDALSRDELIPMLRETAERAKESLQ